MYESKFIDNISKEILKVISDGPLDVAEKLVNVDGRVHELNLLRFVRSDKVHMIGICGFSGIGKTTLAKAIYNSMWTYFEGCDDVQGATKRQGLTEVQMQMFEKILKTENLEISSVSKGTKLEALVGSPDWFSLGNNYKALELFSLNAFGKSREDFKEFAFQIVKYLQDIQQKLRLSFDGLASDQKRMFLDIACAFIRENKDFAASILDSSNCSANAIIKGLVDKSLITVSASNMSLQMHELIQNMAREIVRENFDMTGNRSRLWISSEFNDSLSKTILG
ncbi:NB-ARC domains-containing protein [Tanacetum coccineum]